MKVFHILNLRGIGGVQSQFEIFYNSLSDKQKSFNFILNTSRIDPAYSSLDLSKKNLFRKVLIYFFHNNVVVHSYNNLVSKKFFYFYNFIRPKNLIFHERGNAWNVDSSQRKLVIKNANLSKQIICNSNAAKIILNKKFGVNSEKLKVIYNGVISDHMVLKARKNFIKKSRSKFIIGYVGRLETNKGVHSLIKSMHYLDDEEFQLNIIGDGGLRSELERYSTELDIKSIKFMGRIENAWSKMKDFDVIVVPSLREPLGNVIIEAALNRVPVIASRVDGIVEIINDKESGILLTPTLPVNNRFISKQVPLPEFVVDVAKNKLNEPKELNPKDIMEAIKFIQTNEKKAQEFTTKLYDDVIDKFHIKKYTKELIQVYLKVLN